MLIKFNYLLIQAQGSFDSPISRWYYLIFIAEWLLVQYRRIGSPSSPVKLKKLALT